MVQIDVWPQGQIQLINYPLQTVSLIITTRVHIILRCPVITQGIHTWVSGNVGFILQAAVIKTTLALHKPTIQVSLFGGRSSFKRLPPGVFRQGHVPLFDACTIYIEIKLISPYGLERLDRNKCVLVQRDGNHSAHFSIKIYIF